MEELDSAEGYACNIQRDENIFSLHAFVARVLLYEHF